VGDKMGVEKGGGCGFGWLIAARIRRVLLLSDRCGKKARMDGDEIYGREHKPT